MTTEQEYPLGPVLEFLSQWWALNHAFERASKRMQSRIGITTQQRIMVRVIGRFPGITPGQLARILHLDPGSVSAAVRRLEERRIVERRRAGRDGRRVSLGLTAHGRQLDVPDSGTIEGALERLLLRSRPEDIETVRVFISRFVAELGDAPQR